MGAMNPEDTPLAMVSAEQHVPVVSFLLSLSTVLDVLWCFLGTVSNSVFQSSLEFVTMVCPGIIRRITRASPLSLVGKMSVETYDSKHRPR